MKGNSPLFCPKNSIAYGDINLPSGDKTFFINAAKRSDIDANGYLDILAHGNASSIRLEINGKELKINWRELAKIIKKNPQFRNKGIRLLSCNTGSAPDGFAQNLANKLGIPVKAPNNLLWAYSNGVLIVAPRASSDRNSPNYKRPHPTIRGCFVTYYPGGNKK